MWKRSKKVETKPVVLKEKGFKYKLLQTTVDQPMLDKLAREGWEIASIAPLGKIFQIILKKNL